METVVLEIGSGKTKIGFSGSDLPSNVYPTITGKRYSSSLFEPNFYIGSDAVKNLDVLQISTPVERGLIKDFESVEKIIQYSLSDLLNSPEDSLKLFFINSIETDLKTKQKLVEILFEKFNISELTFKKTPSLSLYSRGKTSGISVEIGHGLCSVSTIIDGKLLEGGRNGKQILYIGGYDLTKMIIKSLNLKSYFNRYIIANQIKEKYCSFMEIDEIEYKLPDDKTLKIHDERKLGEIFFNPSLFDKDQIYGLKDMIIHGIENTESERKLVASNIFLSGGSSLIQGFNERVHSELNDFHIHTKVISSGKEREYASWIGGSMISSQNSFHWLSSEQYKENGTKVIGKYFND